MSILILGLIVSYIILGSLAYKTGFKVGMTFTSRFSDLRYQKITEPENLFQSIIYKIADDIWEQAKNDR